VLLRDYRAEQPGPEKVIEILPREGHRLVVPGGAGREVPVRQFPGTADDGLLFGIQVRHNGPLP
jgi:hypothetical protein